MPTSTSTHEESSTAKPKEPFTPTPTGGNPTVDPQRRRGPGRPGADDPLAHVSTRDHILSNAITQFRHRGFASVSLNDIARGAGLTKASLYYHFHSKEELFTQALVGLLHRVASAVEAVVDQPAPLRDRLVALAADRLESVATGRDTESLLREAEPTLPPELYRSIRSAQQRVTALLVRTMARGIAEGELVDQDPVFLAHAFVALMAMVGARGEGGELLFPCNRATADRLVAFFLHGAGVPRET